MIPAMAPTATLLAVACLCQLLMAIMEVCARLPDPPIFAAVQHYPSICYLPPDSGLCNSSAGLENNLPRFSPSRSSYRLYSNGRFRRLVPTPNDSNYESRQPRQPLLTLYYFDATTGECYPFSAQNCGGNENRFERLRDCQEMCRLRE